MEGTVDDENLIVDATALTDLKTYLLNVCVLLFRTCTDSVLDSFDLAENSAALSSFVGNPDVMCLFVSLTRGGPSASGVCCSLKVIDDASGVSNSTQGILSIVKSVARSITADRPINEQVNMLTLGNAFDSSSVSTTDATKFTDIDGKNEGYNYSNFAMMQNFLKYAIAPIVQRQQAAVPVVTSSGDVNNGNTERYNSLYKCLRELDTALDQIQRGDCILRPDFHTLPELSAVCNQTTTEELKNHLEKFNPSNVDQLFDSFEPSLLLRMGETPQQKEAFANDVHKMAKQWPAEIGKLVRVADLPISSNSSDPFINIESEVKFWKDLNKVLGETKETLINDPQVLLTKLLLKRTNRVSEQLISEAEMQLDTAVSTVQSCVLFVKDLSSLEAVAAPSSIASLHPHLSKVVASTCQHFLKYRFNSKVYEFNRAMKLFEMVGLAFCQQIRNVLRSKNLFQCSAKEFLQVYDEAVEVFTVWKVEFVQVKSMLKDVAQRNHKNQKVKNFAFDFDALQSRLVAVKEFRDQHDRMVTVTNAVLQRDGENVQSGSIGSELLEAYNYVVRSIVDIMDISASGESIWQEAKHGYEKRLESIDDNIVAMLTNSLQNCHSANDMFRVFSVYNPLFFRNTIRQAVNSSRTTLVKNVREDVLRLREKFKSKYDVSHEKVTSDLKDIPPLSGSIMWARQIEQQFSTLMKRMEDLLGKGWESHVEGKQLKEICDELRGNLDTDTLYKDWVSAQLKSDAITSANLLSSGGSVRTRDKLLFTIESDPITQKKSVGVNFDSRHIVLYKEIHYLEWLLPSTNSVHKTIPATLKELAKVAAVRHPIAMALQGALSSIAQTKRTLSASPEIYMLVTKYLLSVRKMIEDAFGGIDADVKPTGMVDWDSSAEQLDDWIQDFSQKVSNLQERVAEIIRISELIQKYLGDLERCEYNKDAFLLSINGIQLLVDEMQTKGYSNIQKWADELHAKIENILVVRLTDAIKVWVDSFLAASATDESKRSSTLQQDIVMPLTVHEIALSNQYLYISPPIEESRISWIRHFHAHIEIITALPRISTSRYQVFHSNHSNSSEQKLSDFSSLLSKLDSELIGRPFEVMEKAMSESDAFAKQWLQYQTLWDVVSVSDVTDSIDRKDVLRWQQLLSDIKVARATIESNAEEKSFGPIVINYRLVQNKVNMKYDSWQKECQMKFGVILLDDLKSTFEDLVSLKSKLEKIHLDGAATNTKDVIFGVELLCEVKNILNSRKERCIHLESGEKMLIKQRYQFPGDWLYVTNVLSVLSDVEQIFDKRNSLMEKQLPVLQSKIYEEDASLTKRVNKFQEDWEDQHPVDGQVVPATALQVLSMFSSQLLVLQEEVRRINAAKTAMGLVAGNQAAGLSKAASISASFNDMTLGSVAEEISDLNDVWSVVITTHEKLFGLRNTLLFKEGVTPMFVRKSLDGLGEELRSMPAKVRSYAPYEYLQSKIAKCLTYQPLLRDICNDVLKDRHWKILIKNLSLPVSGGYATELTIGMIWDSTALSHKKMIGEVLATAQGEQALHQFLKEMKEYWVSCELTLVVREGGFRVISGWDMLFSMLEDHLNSLSSLKQSPYFNNVQEFHEDTSLWELKLTNLRAIFEIWIEVQRKWIYLRGIFKNADIKAQLPAQFSKYKSVDNEFVSLLKKVSVKPIVVDLLLLENLPKQLERQDASMAMIQKALGEYLERQRQMFPRFYFVNNDDLVEILGNANEPTKILGHIGKMFAAVTHLDIVTPVDHPERNDSSLVQHGVSMSSKDGEKVRLLKPVAICNGNVKDWLAELESTMIVTLASSLQDSILLRAKSGAAFEESDRTVFIEWVNSFPVQVIGLCSNVMWTAGVEQALTSSTKDAVVSTLKNTEGELRVLSEHVLGNDMEIVLRKKCEQLITAFVHQRDVVRTLLHEGVTIKSDFKWLYHLRFYWNMDSSSPKKSDLADSTQLIQKLNIRMSNAAFYYGFEYLGIGERLVQTPLTDRCYLTLTQALHFRMGGNPFGPAGTGKTESVKMLGSELGRFVLVFNCDENFDYSAMGRIFAGLCQVGAWGCFDEFNRLEERILSAVSQQILTIQRGLMAHVSTIELLGNQCNLHKDVGVFVTMNPGYAGRSNLPDNLKQLFRGVAMTVPDRKMIAQVMLFSQGIVTAEELARKIVLLFTLCEEQLSVQSHYDFGLRALKSVLSGAGDLKRKVVNQRSDASTLNVAETEKNVLILSLCNSISPKLVPDDISLYESLLQSVFPDSELPALEDPSLVEALQKICYDEYLEYSDRWVEKVLQLKQVLEMRHGVMMVGPSGSGKSSAWRCLLKGLQRVDGIKGDYYVIDPKAMKKDKLFGSLDPNTLEWTDGVFTKILRKIIEQNGIRGSATDIGTDYSGSNSTPMKKSQSATGAPVTTARRSWIVFDGDVDPEWAENLNSVLDDNKILTLPTGDRLKLPDNLRIMMEVESLKHATLATVSRCGMVWFAQDTVSLDMILIQQMHCLRDGVAMGKHASTGRVTYGSTSSGGVAHNRLSPGEADVRSKFVDAIAPYLKASPDLAGVALDFAMEKRHIMEPNRGRLLTTLFSMLSRGIHNILQYNDTNPDFPMTDEHLNMFSLKWLLYSLLWSFGGSMPWNSRVALGSLLSSHSNVDLPPRAELVDVQVNVQDGTWVEWVASVPKTDLDAHKVITNSDVVVTTTDTVRHTEVMSAWLSSHQPLILCGPPGSGKTMTLSSVIEAHPEFVLATLNFSSGTSPDILLKVFAQYCEVIESPDGLIMQPSHQSYSEDKWLVVFCDEINLPAVDKYGTQRVIMFMRQLTEQGGFWRSSDCKWIKLRRIQFVGACNAPSDAGRVSLSPRFMRHAPLLMVDYPAEASLKQIYRCFNTALLKLHSNLRGSVEALTNAMVEFYVLNQVKFTVDIAPQYIYSPRELSRWVRGMYEAMEPLEVMTMQELVRLWAHEGLRLFQDRLITRVEKDWCDEALNEIAAKYFGNSVDIEMALQRPMLYSNWLSKVYQSTKLEDFYHFVSARLKVFYEEELDVPLVLFDDVISHVLRIDNVLRHPMGHMLLVGDSGVGKTVLTKFVAWINGLKIFQIKANNRYTLDQFDEDLRCLLRRVALEGEKVCFIFDESNVLSSAFLERMNSLLASGEVPGLFQGEELTQLMAGCRDVFLQRDGLILDSGDEIWRQFTKLIRRNLHVVFTMNPASADFDNRCTTSPALFNRCVVDWFGTWSQSGLTQVAHEFTKILDTGYTEYEPPAMSKMPGSMVTVMDVVSNVIGSTVTSSSAPTLHNAVVAALVAIHDYIYNFTQSLAKSSVSSRSYYVSPRDALDLIKKFMSIEQEKRAYLEEHQTHVRAGLNKLVETQEQVGTLQSEMKLKEATLLAKDTEANQKLALMLEKQAEAEARKKVAEELTVELNRRHEEIRIRKESVQVELADAEPSLMAAKHSVQNIRKAQLDELRALARPPAPVRGTLEAVIMMIAGEKPNEWIDIRKSIRKDDFITTVVNFDPLQLSQKIVKAVQDEYFGANSDLDYASVDRASKACGPLYQWADSQIKYATILRKVKPLRDEVEKLESESDALSVSQKKAVEEVNSLEEILATYKTEYAAVIRETEVIRTESELVRKKVSRAESLLGSLNEERDRWQDTWQNFDTQMSTLIGDCILSAAFLTYAGGFDQASRRSMFNDWSDILDSLQIPFRADMDIISYLSLPSDQLAWSEYGLATDELVMQNAILLQRFNRFPLVIDPSGQASSFLLKKYASQKIIQTSFLDASFLKTLASSVRFGTPLLVHDVENVDPILNPVLNREFQKTGGRTLIRLGNEDVDFSPKFMIILLTRNPMAKFAPDLCSRVTLVNFTITHSSLESQMLSTILCNERPDVDRKRTEVLRLQSAQSLKLRELEELLLNKISAIKGAILDDDSIINTLEIIKNESFELNREVKKTEELLLELKSIAKIYEPLAHVIATIYFTLEKISDINYFYQFSLQYYMEIIRKVLLQNATHAADLNADSDAIQVVDVKLAKQRLSILTKAVFHEVCRRILRSLRHEDKLLFTARLAQISVQQIMILQKSGVSEELLLSDAEYDVLYSGYQSVSTSISGKKQDQIKKCLTNNEFDDVTTRNIQALLLLPAYKKLVDDMNESPSEWNTFLHATEPEECIPMGWHGSAKQNTRGSSGVAPTRECLLKLILIRVFRPDRILPMMEKFITLSMCESESNVSEGSNAEFDWHAYSNKLDLHTLVYLDCKSNMPILLCSTSGGQDISSKIDALAADEPQGAVELFQVAMGSNEGYQQADKSLSLGMKSGSWVLLKNIHLCSLEWLELLEKKIHSSGTGVCSSAFRLFLTCEISASTTPIPVSLLRACETVIIEPSTGIKANLQRFFASTVVPHNRMDKPPFERSRLYALLGWLHAVIQERLRYVPYGWTKKYEFSEVDAQCALNVIDAWVDGGASAGLTSDTQAVKKHIDPENLPWDAIRKLLLETIYGGRIDNSFDYGVLDSFIKSIFRPEMYSSDVPLVVLPRGSSGESDAQEHKLILPERLGREAIELWVESLPNDNAPDWIGLPTSAEMERQQSIGMNLLSNLQKLTKSTLAVSSTSKALCGSKGNYNQYEDVINLTTKWLEALPEEKLMKSLRDAATASVMGNDGGLSALPIPRFMLREVVKADCLIQMILEDVKLLKEVCLGKSKHSSTSRLLLKQLVNERNLNVPLKWLNQLQMSGSTGSSTTSSSTTSTSIMEWISNVALRWFALNKYYKNGSVVSHYDYWIGGMFAPEAFITASRQYVASVNKWNLEDMELYLDINVSAANDNGVTMFSLVGLWIECASWNANKNCIDILGPDGKSDVMKSQLPTCQLRWGLLTSTNADALYLKIPVYSNSTRCHRLFDVHIDVTASVGNNSLRALESAWLQRGIAFVAQGME